MRRRLARIPRPLLCLLVLVALEGTAWALVLPPLQGADEAGHVVYVQHIADGHHLPWTLTGTVLDRDEANAYSSEIVAAWRAAGTEPLRGNVAARPLWTDADERVYRDAAAHLPPGGRSKGGTAPTFRNPPLAYLYGTVPYWLARHTGGDLFTAMSVMRLANLLWLLVVVGATWLLAGEAFRGSGRWAQTLAAGVVAVHPLLLNVASGFTPDLMLCAWWSLALWLAARTVRLGPTRRHAAELFGVAILGTLTHGRDVPLLLVAGVVLALAWHRHRERTVWNPPSARAMSWAMAGGFLPVLIGLTSYATRGQLWPWSGRVREFFSYVWQFYLPNPGFLTDPLFPGFGVRQVFVDRFFASFVQFEVFFSGGTERWLVRGCVAGLLLLVVALWRGRHAIARHAPELFALLLTTVVGTLLFLHAVAYRGILRTPSDPVFTGRYLLPLLPIFALAVVFALRALPRRASILTGAAVLALGFVLQLGALGLVVERFYA